MTNLPFHYATIDLPDEPVPLTGVFDSGSWAVIDMVLAASAFLAFLALTGILLYRYFQSLRPKPFTGQEAGPGNQTDDPAGRQSDFLGKSFPWLAASTFSAMLIIFLFAFSQDFGGIMHAYDRWSIAMSVLYVVQLATASIALRLSTDSRHALKNDSDDLPLSEPDQAPQHGEQGARRIKLRGTRPGYFEDDGDTDEQ